MCRIRGRVGGNQHNLPDKILEKPTLRHGAVRDNHTHIRHPDRMGNLNGKLKNGKPHTRSPAVGSLSGIHRRSALDGQRDNLVTITAHSVPRACDKPWRNMRPHSRPPPCNQGHIPSNSQSAQPNSARHLQPICCGANADLQKRRGARNNPRHLLAHIHEHSQQSLLNGPPYNGDSKSDGSDGRRHDIQDISAVPLPRDTLRNACHPLHLFPAPHHGGNDGSLQRPWILHKKLLRLRQLHQRHSRNHTDRDCDKHIEHIPELRREKACEVEGVNNELFHLFL